MSVCPACSVVKRGRLDWKLFWKWFDGTLGHMGNEGCRNGTLPPQVGGDFMGAPQSLEVEGELFKDNSGNLHPQVVVTWEPPAQGAGFHSLKGFYVKIYKIPGNSVFRCYVFDFSQSNFTLSDHKLKFKKKILGIDGGSDHLYLLEMYTLPMSAGSKSKGRYFTLQPFQDGKSPGDWSAALTYKGDNRMAPADITVRFSLAPKEYKFSRYVVKLVGARNSLNAVNKCEIDINHDSSCEGVIIHQPTENASSIALTFFELQADRYKIRIQPKDSYGWMRGRCLCYQKTSNTSRHCVSCLTTLTDWINVTQHEDASSAPSTSPVATDTYATSQDPGVVESKDASSVPSISPVARDILATSQDPGVVETTVSQRLITVVAGTVGVLIGCGLVCMVVVTQWGKKLSRATQRFMYNSIPTRDLGHGTHSRPALYVRKVYLMYAEDHKDHMNVITNLASHLKNHCCCEVFFLRWFPRAVQTMGVYQWILTHIDQADFVIIINSEAAFKLFETRNTNASLRRLDEGPEGDIFSPALTHVMAKSSEPGFFKKTILAHFDYTDEDFILKEVSPGVQYMLPKHFKEFLCHIHEMSGQSDLDDMVNLHATSSGRQLLEAIRKAKHFQKSDPQWFDKRFYRQEDSAYDSLSESKCDSPVGVDDSVSIATRPLRGIYTRPSKSDNADADDLKSTVTYNTDYARAHGDYVFDVIPPSEVSVGATTEFLYRQLDSINKQNENNSIGFIPVRTVRTEMDETSLSTYMVDPPDAAGQGDSQPDSPISVEGRDV
ncbi:interleukin cytokine receptor-related protein 1-like isoform X2 [Haliotis cracherodii]|uniref:interleukin cytokine receptor-related protein 1-like isoform X2 n=1 Tax=Haliotis cracherodii TaxID=6455 RepID=UPI0039E9FB43